MKNFADKLLKSVKTFQNPSCIGLDPRLEDIPQFLKKGGISKIIFNFNKAIIDATLDIVGIYKIQLALYERHKIEGLIAFEKTLEYLKEKKKIIIIDGKRNDIKEIAEIYAETFLSPKGYDADALTINPYFGSDGVLPFVEIAKKHKKGVFVLIKTSNPSSKEFQDLVFKNKKRFYEMVAEKIKEWGKNTEGKEGYQIVGGIVGANFPKEAKRIRKIIPKNIILVPGYGTQGGKAVDVIANFNPDKKGAIVNSSRGIIFAFKKEKFRKKFKEKQFDLAAREAAIEMKKDLNCALCSYFP